MCLECGARVALVYRRPPELEGPVAITAVVALLLGGAAAAAVSRPQRRRRSRGRRRAAAAERDQDPRRSPRRTPSKKEETRPKEEAQRRSRPRRKAKAEPETATTAGGLTQRGALYGWPGTLEGFTVVINSTEDRASATTFARSASKSKPAKLGVIRADDFKTLPKGFYVVFAGYYESRGKADKATARLGRKYQGAFTQSVQR